MSATIPEEFALFTVEETIVYPIATLSVTYFIYGFYILLFGSCVYMMRSRRREDEPRYLNLYLSLTVALFALSTMFIAAFTLSLVARATVLFTALKLEEYEHFTDYELHSITKIVSFSIQQLTIVLLNSTADYMLIYRCYVIWGSRKRVAVPLIVASVLTNVLGFVSFVVITISDTDLTINSEDTLFIIGDDFSSVYSISSGVVNSVLTLLTAGRIWWIHRKARAHGVQTSDNFMYSVARIILESGIIYPGFIIAGLIMTNIDGLSDLPFDFYPLVAMSAGIAPTLIMVRAKLGMNVESLQGTVSEIRFTSIPAAGGVTPVFSIGNLSTVAPLESERRSARAVYEKDTIAV
ncbi:hypothetical protein Moror_7577 [Moniliophthora roreri MCA 2997]|uniref:Uncharacterized protein n=1 Tax=Moniliophthora roreri (strain MCA 2997) TaxID=1381753 RepID=V2XWV3_MONRO|nr:hypothetical protein Moror_7577 [Moniliophthora roreri MCA 2997]